MPVEKPEAKKRAAEMFGFLRRQSVPQLVTLHTDGVIDDGEFRAALLDVFVDLKPHELVDVLALDLPTEQKRALIEARASKDAVRRTEQRERKKNYTAKLNRRRTVWRR